MPAAALAVSPFRWQDGERLVRFGRGTLNEGPDLLGEDYQLLTTTRALQAAPDLAEGAAEVRESVRGELLVALGGGRVIDVAKALAAADPPRRVAAVPTTLSAAEMTALHRHVSEVPAATPGSVRRSSSTIPPSAPRSPRRSSPPRRSTRWRTP